MLAMPTPPPKANTPIAARRNLRMFSFLHPDGDRPRMMFARRGLACGLTVE